MESVSLSYIKNPHCERDVKYSFYANKILYYITLIWCVKKQSLTLRLSVSLLRLCLHFGTMFFVLGMTFDIIVNVKGGELKLKLFLNTVLFFWYHVKYIILLINGKSIQMCYEQLYSLWENIFFGSRKHMIDYAKQGRKMSMISIVLVYMVVMSFQAVAFMEKVVVVDNLTIHNLPYPSHYFIFDSRLAPFYYYMHGYHILMQIFFGALVSSTCTPAVFAIHISGQYDLLIYFVETKLNFEDCRTNFKTKVQMIVKKHHDLIRCG